MFASQARRPEEEEEDTRRMRHQSVGSGHLKVSPIRKRVKGQIMTKFTVVMRNRSLGSSCTQQRHRHDYSLKRPSCTRMEQLVHT